MKYNWYNLIGDLKNTLKVDLGEPTVNAVAFNNIVDSLTWYNLKNSLQNLVGLINHTETILDLNITWYNIPSKAESIYNNFN
jgi:hypothetical protein